MAGRPEAGVLPRRKLTTYGKAVRKRQPKNVFTPVTASESMSEEDPIATATGTPTRHQPKLAPSPFRGSPKSDSQSRGSPNNPERFAKSPARIPNSERKRKLSQLHTSSHQKEDASRSSDDSLPPDPEPRHSRKAVGNSSRPSASTPEARRQPTATQQMNIEIAEARLSSPPPTPTPPRAPRATLAKSPQTIKPAHVKRYRANDTGRGNPQHHQIPLHLARDSSRKLQSSHASSITKPERRQATPVHRTSPASTRVVKKPRKRLIDTLVEQTPLSDPVDDDSENLTESNQAVSSQMSDTPMRDSQDLPTTPSASNNATQVASTRRTFARSSSALKFTYGQGIKVLEEEEDSLLDAFAIPEEFSTPLKGRRLELGNPKKLTNPGGLSDEDDTISGASPNFKLRGIHELRQAGANSRVADAMQDLNDQIGTPSIKPSSSRRAALLQVAERIKDKSFMRQCRDHGVEATMLKDVGEESDIISGYLILSTLVVTIAKWPSSHINRLLRLEDSSPLFARLLGAPDDIKTLARDRKSNLSKRSQNSLLAIQNSVRELPIWNEASPTTMSPRTLALKCLELLITQDSGIGRDPMIFSSAVSDRIFSVLSDATTDAESWNYPDSVASLDLFGALSVLDYHAVSVAELRRGSNEWATRYLATVAEVFNALLGAPRKEDKRLEGAVLKLIINVSNNDMEAPDVFASKGLLPVLAGSISRNFTEVLTTISQETWTYTVIDSLILELGILINFSEHSGIVRQIVDQCQYDGRKPVDEFIRLFLDNHRRTSEADSMEKSHLNVAFGYLSVLLGYLSLHTPIRQRLKMSHSAKSIGPLIDSLREFIEHHKKLESAIEHHKKLESAIEHSGDDAHPQSDYTERLQDLVHQLEEKAAYD